jgi:hypothetical protein
MPEVTQQWKTTAVGTLVLADEGACAVSSLDEVMAFFQQAIAWYRQNGTPTARTELKGWEALSDRVLAVDVEWLALDASGVEKARDASHYLMRVGDDQRLRVHVAMSRRVPKK